MKLTLDHVTVAGQSLDALTAEAWCNAIDESVEIVIETQDGVGIP